MHGSADANTIATANLTVASSPFRTESSALPPVPAGENISPAPIDPSIDKWFFISGAAM